jgi:hypothetical protein
MRRVHARRTWYLLTDNSYESLEAYIDATRAALVVDLHAYQAEVAAAEAAHRKRTARSSRPSAPPSPLRLRARRPGAARVQARARQRVICASFIKEEGPQTPFVSLYKVIDAL